MKFWHTLAVFSVAFWLALGGWAAVMYGKLKTGLPRLDALRVPLIVSLLRHGLLLPEHGRALMAIFHNEHSDGSSTSDITNPMQLGDLQHSGGPSVGPGQVLFKTAWELGLWSRHERAAFVAFGSDPAQLWELIDWAVRVYESKLALAKGDVNEAIKLYNGSGVKAANYQASALAFEEQALSRGAS